MWRHRILRARGGSGRCEHKRERRRCKDCGGSGICEHERIRNRCTDCNPDYVKPVSKCEHHPLQPKQTCKFCPGPRICPLHFKYRKADTCSHCRKKKPAVRCRFVHTVVEMRGSQPVFSGTIDEEERIAEKVRTGVLSTEEQVEEERARWRSLRGTGRCAVRV